MDQMEQAEKQQTKEEYAPRREGSVTGVGSGQSPFLLPFTALENPSSSHVLVSVYICKPANP